MHFPEEGLVWSIGSGYGGNALLGKKCFSLRIASWLGYRQGWLAEHMVIIGVEDLHGKVTYITAAMPSACGKTNLAMLESALPEYKVWTIGDDIAWLNIGPDGRLYAINPESGFFGVAPGTSMKTNPNMIRTLKASKFYPTIFTNVGLNTGHERALVGRAGRAGPGEHGGLAGPALGPDPWGRRRPIRIRGSRCRIYNCPTLSPEFDNPQGVPISAIILGGRRSQLIPLVTEAFNWDARRLHGGADGVGDDGRGRRQGRRAATRPDGHAALLRLQHGRLLPPLDQHRPAACQAAADLRDERVPRRRRQGKFLWPGFGENIRVLKWIIDRVNGRAGARETPFGLVPGPGELFRPTGWTFPGRTCRSCSRSSPGEWEEELQDIRVFLDRFGQHLPYEIRREYEKMASGLKG